MFNRECSHGLNFIVVVKVGCRNNIRKVTASCTFTVMMGQYPHLLE